ncbi:MAG TPA: hypothetical protein VK933_16030 [Longimicrobiales bacterium]|nr:hypothetical protein [Longimicrobiales bacterium]
MVRKMILTAAVAILVLPAMASAQTVNATATVSPASAVTGSGDVDFGTLSTAVDNVIDATAGTVTRTLTYNHNLTVSFSNVSAALSSAGLTDLPVALDCAWELGGTWSAAAACSTASFDIDVGSVQTVATLGFGGTILAADVANAAAGTYTASFDIVLTAR